MISSTSGKNENTGKLDHGFKPQISYVNYD